jgi:hypothetical protein
MALRIQAAISAAKQTSCRASMAHICFRAPDQFNSGQRRFDFPSAQTLWQNQASIVTIEYVSGQAVLPIIPIHNTAGFADQVIHFKYYRGQSLSLR